jgi:hypothetical protein
VSRVVTYTSPQRPFEVTFQDGELLPDQTRGWIPAVLPQRSISDRIVVKRLVLGHAGGRDSQVTRRRGRVAAR